VSNLRQGSHSLNEERNLHGLAGKGVDDFLGVKVLLPVRILCEELAGTVPEQLVVGYLELKGA
jgi:hypothetical protein